MKYVFKQETDRNYYNQVMVEGIPEELIENGKWCCFRMKCTADKRYTKFLFNRSQVLLLIQEMKEHLQIFQRLMKIIVGNSMTILELVFYLLMVLP